MARTCRCRDGCRSSPATGTVLKTEMSVADTSVIATVAVEFREDTSLDLWVPAEMTEYYKATMSADEIRCTATYSNYRKFSVSTDEEIQKPPTGKKPPGLKRTPADIRAKRSLMVTPTLVPDPPVRPPTGRVRLPVMLFRWISPDCEMIVALAATVALGCGNSPSAAQRHPPSPAPATAGGADPVVAEVGGRKITLSEVDAKWQEFDAAERARLTQLLYQNRRNMLELLVGDVLIADAAKTANMTPEAYTEREISKRAQPSAKPRSRSSTKRTRNGRRGGRWSSCGSRSWSSCRGSGRARRARSWWTSSGTRPRT